MMPLLLLLLSLPEAPPASAAAGDPTPTPTPWPPQFHAKLVMDYHGNLSVADLWYDWPGGRNLHWNNGTSFFYTPSRRACRSAAVGVGILRPDWLRPGAVYLGRRDAGGFDCHVWAKADFITYYEDVKTKRPVKWVFYTGRIAYVMSFEVGAVLEDAAWQAPEYCFNKDGGIAETAGGHHDDSFAPWSVL
ncbi:hypothetical protein C2845_PM02G41480 [Panicum miliaceum]|uniref:Uncharacterized protein n=1 Tax=Panicum miliaceum TaxID=4540 RepID=A0A3L6S380_PANMI|nr:hypothetical protein C2845_PM02G41480 [Panicum miliaceum]